LIENILTASQAVPVISTRLSGIPELIIDGDTGLLAEPDNDLDLSIKLNQLLRDTELDYRLKSQEQAHVQE
jgi:glycosyltransferase involved in cell wall biosynthesis